VMLSSNVPPSERGRGGAKGPRHCPQPPATKHIHVFSSTTETTTTSGLSQQRYGSIAQTRGREGDGSKATASRYVKIKGTSYRPNTRGKMNDLTAQNAFRR
jgi:hypothetical protein